MSGPAPLNLDGTHARFAPERTAGAITIAHLGRAQREWLIISGSQKRGTIWSDCRTDDADLAPLLASHDRPGHGH